MFGTIDPHSLALYSTLHVHTWHYLRVLVGKLRPENDENCVHVKALLDINPRTSSPLSQHAVRPSHEQVPVLRRKIICLMKVILFL